MEREYENSLKIHRNGYQKGESKDYFVKLYQTIINELRTRGFSEYMDILWDNRPDRLDIIEYSVVNAVHYYYRSGTVLNVENSDYVPNFNSYREVMWNECRSGNSYITFHPKKFMNMVITIIREGRKEHLEYLDNVIRENQSKMNNGYSSNSVHHSESEEILESARIEAARIIREAHEETKGHREAAYGEISEIREKAKNDASKIIEDAKTYSEELKMNIKEEIFDMKREAQEKIDDMRKEADMELAERRQEMESCSAEYAKKMINRNIAQYQSEARKSLYQELEQYKEASEQQTEKMSQLHSEMCASTNALQAEWVKSLDRTFAQLSDLKTDFYEKLHDWQVALYPAKYQAIAERYTELYRILNLDKMIREEILYQNPTEESIEHTEATTPAPETVRALQKLNGTLTIFLKKFEQSLSGLGLYVYYPAEGEEFNEVLHSCRDESFEEELYEYEFIIDQCIVPGIRKKNQAEFEDDVVIPATVTVRRADQ